MHTGIKARKGPQGKRWGDLDLPDDGVSAFLRTHQRRIDLEVIYPVGMYSFVLRGSLAQRSIAPTPLSFHQHRQRTAHADQPRRQVSQNISAVGHPLRLDRKSGG